MNWGMILENSLTYGPLGVVFFVYIKSNFKKQEELIRMSSEKEHQSQQNYQKLLDTVITSSDKNIQKLETAVGRLSDNIEKSNKFYDMALDDISDAILKVKENCGVNCNQLFSAIYEERGVPKITACQLMEHIIENKILESVVDISTNIDENGFSKVENVEQLKDNIIRILCRRKNELVEMITRLNIKDKDEQLRNDFILDLQNIHSVLMTKIKEKVISQLSVASFQDDKNYKRLKGSIKNVVFTYREDLIKLLHDIFK